MNHPSLKKTLFAGYSALALCSLVYLSVFSNGCAFDPFTETSSSDTVTYNITGTVLDSIKNTPIQNIKVYFRDTSASVKSPVVATDSAQGAYSLSYKYIKRNSLLLYFEDVDDTAHGGRYQKDSVELFFKEANYTYGIEQNVKLIH